MESEEKFRMYLKADDAKKTVRAQCQCGTKDFPREDDTYIVRCTACGWRTEIRAIIGPVTKEAPVNQSFLERTYRG